MARCPTCHRRLQSGQACAQHGGAIAPVAERGDPRGAPREDNAATPIWSQPLSECIGSGGFAAVWQVAGRDLVLKVAHADHELARARMRREAEALAGIGAPAVPRIDGEGVLADGRAWILMERITGTNLADLNAAGSLRIDQAIAIAVGILEALVRVHAAGFVHRDLKPDNIVRRADGSLVILDLGLARKWPVDPDDPTRAGVQVGSLEYMPPEQILDAAAVDPRADLYAFGCILYELCAGRPPFIGDASALERAHAALRPPPLGALATVPPTIEALCHECLAKQAARRPASAADLLERLRIVASEPSLEQRHQHSMSVISEGTQPVVLLWAELPRVDRTLLGMLAARKITVVSQRGRRVLGGVVGAEHADPVGAAIAAGRDLAGAGARVALHLDALAVTSKSGGIALAGSAVDKPEDWLPAQPWTGVVLTRALATVTQAPTRVMPALGAGFVVLGEPGETTQLFGREAMLSDLAADAAAALAGGGPAVALLVGDHGVGKTALAAALAPRLRELGARVVIATVPPPGSGRPGHAGLVELVGTPQGPVIRAVGDALRTAARARPTAIILDDIHLAEHELLDALEYATLGGEALPLWIACLATHRIDQRRPDFGARAERHRRDVLPPLEEEAAVAMTAELLKPAEYPPLRALRQIAAIARGNPMHLATLAREIHDRGAIRTRPNGEHFLDTTALDALPPVALGPWLAARELAHLSVELVALARLCAVLGEDIQRAELADVMHAVERRGGATTTIDVDVGLAELEAARILIREGEHWTFRQALLHEGIYATTNEAERAVLHAAALDHWRTRDLHDPAVAARVARHAEEVGDGAAAAAAFATLATYAHSQHRHLEADQAWSGALRHLDKPDAARGRSLVGRARARYRIQRVRDALADLDAAIAIAVAIGDATLEIQALLERATALDWSTEFARSKEVAESAVRRFELDTSASRDLKPELDLAYGRSLFRDNRLADSVPVLRAVMASGRPEQQTIAGLLLGCSLVDLGALDDAERVFGDVIRICEASGDRFHLAAGYQNRTWLWSARGATERVGEDLEVVIGLAREGGYSVVEARATHGLAENKLWDGNLDEALRLIRRSLALADTAGETDTSNDRVLLARIFAALGDREAFVSTVRSIDDVGLFDEAARMLRVLRAICADADDAALEASLAEMAVLPSTHRVEMLRIVAAYHRLVPARVDEMLALAARDPIWSRRMTELQQALSTRP